MSRQTSSGPKIRATRRTAPAAAAPPEPQPGLRERKKQETRRTISDVATRLFVERGFDQVTVASVAEAAGVSVNTIFNYFTTKEELFFDRGDEFRDAPAEIVRARLPGEDVITALARGLRERGALAVYRSAKVRGFFATIEASPALKARERALFEQSEARLAEALQRELRARADDPTPRLVAAFITALEWRLAQEFRTRLLRDEPEAKIRAALVRMFDRGIALLRDGVGVIGKP